MLLAARYWLLADFCQTLVASCYANWIRFDEQIFGNTKQRNIQQRKL